MERNTLLILIFVISCVVLLAYTVVQSISLYVIRRVDEQTAKTEKELRNRESTVDYDVKYYFG